MTTFDKAASVAGKAKLEAAGWIKVASVMSDQAQDGKFGTHFIKDGKEFWFNKDTFQNLPV